MGDFQRLCKSIMRAVERGEPLDEYWAEAETLVHKAAGCRVLKAHSNGHGPKRLDKSLAQGARRRSIYDSAWHLRASSRYPGQPN